MISTTQGKQDYLFDDTNHRVLDPATYYAPKSVHEHWTPQEIEIYFQKYAETPKQFGSIADALPNKSAAQCVEFYYMHKQKAVDFRQIVVSYATTTRGRKKKVGGKGKRKGILADIQQHDNDVASSKSRSSRSTRVADTPSSTAASSSAPVSASGRPKRVTKPRASLLEVAAGSRKASGSLPGEGESSTGASTPEPERAPKRKRAPISTIGTASTSSATKPPSATSLPPATASLPSIVALNLQDREEVCCVLSSTIARSTHSF
jgi:hypothetical protein